MITYNEECLIEILSDGFRFYSSSLLIIYDAASLLSSDENLQKSCVKVKIIDFANSALPADKVDHPGPDQGFLLGVQSLHNILEVLLLIENKCI